MATTNANSYFLLHIHCMVFWIWHILYEKDHKNKVQRNQKDFFNTKIKLALSLALSSLDSIANGS